MSISMATQNLHQGPLTDSRWVRRFLQGTAQTTDEKPLIPPEKSKGNLPTFLPFRGPRESWSSLLRQTFHPCCLHNCSSITRPLLPHALTSTFPPSSHLPTWVLRLLLSETLPSTQCFFLIILSPLFTTTPTKRVLYTSLSHLLFTQILNHCNGLGFSTSLPGGKTKQLSSQMSPKNSKLPSAVPSSKLLLLHELPEHWASAFPSLTSFFPGQYHHSRSDLTLATPLFPSLVSVFQKCWYH